jgi:CheY-like chemotaxis protein
MMKSSKKKMNGKVEILIAEDSPTQAAQLAHLLEEHGFVVTTASNGREALALLDRCRPTLIISDILMPELDGSVSAERSRPTKDGSTFWSCW